MKKKTPILCLTPGDPKGIGYEVTWKALQAIHPQNLNVRILCIGAADPFYHLEAPLLEVDSRLTFDELEDQYLSFSKNPFVWIIKAPDFRSLGNPEQLPYPTPLESIEGYQAGWSIEKAVKLILQGSAQGLVTGPISKSNLQRGGFSFEGHTDFLAHLSQTSNVTMMLANDHLKVTLATVHVALKDVTIRLTRERLRTTILQTAEALTSLWEVQRPRIAVCGLNPHCGEDGIFGREEIEVIRPEMEYLRSISDKKFELSGPFSADTLFAQQILLPSHQRFDVIVAMYHDQGLVPVKLVDFKNTVNLTLGLPFIRTSVDHGVAFDIAGKGIADPSSMISAIQTAIELIHKKGA